MKKLNFLFGLATIVATALSFSSCSSEEFGGGNETRGRQVSFTSKVGGSTRTIDDPQSTTVPTDQKIGVFGISDETKTTMTNYNNIEYTVPASGNLTTTNAMTWPTTDGAKVNFYAYAPYNSDWTSHTTAQTFTVASGQSTNAGYLASDLLYATPLENKTETTEALALAFKHKMAKLNITLNNTGTEAITISSVKINNTKPSITFTPSDGTLGAYSGTVTDITALSSAQEIAANGSVTVCAVIVPQPIAANTTLVTITTSDNKTLIAKLGTATTFASEGSYNFTVNITNPTAATTEVLLSLNSTAVTDWTDYNIGATTYGVGDYVLNDGTFVKSTDADFETKKANAIAVIFSTDVSTTDQTRGYVAYAMGLETLGSKTWGNSTSWLGTYISSFAKACGDLDGWEKSASILSWSTYTALSAENKVKVLANLSNYTLSINEGVTNLSGWFTPSIGQMIQILNNLGEAGLNSSTGFADTNSSSVGWGYTGETASQGTSVPSRDAMIAVQTNINGYVTAVGKTAFENKLYATVTESAKNSNANFWHVTFSENGYIIGQNPGKNGATANNGMSIIPCLAIKKLTND